MQNLIELVHEKSELDRKVMYIITDLSVAEFFVMVSYAKALAKIASVYKGETSEENIEAFLEKIENIDCGENDNLIKYYCLEIDEYLANDILLVDTEPLDAIYKVLDIIADFEFNEIKIGGSLNV